MDQPLARNIAAAIAAGKCGHFTLEVSGVRYFVKTAAASRLSMFEAEAAGVELLAAARCVRTPRAIATDVEGDVAWICLEHVQLRPRTPESDARLGLQLAELHGVTHELYGWERDNTIGPTPQVNAWSSDWAAFWSDARLRPQLALAASNGYRGRLQADGERLRGRIRDFFRTYTPAPSLLHGDLWSGNAATDDGGAPVIYDPAVYYGDRESDVAMTELFGGFAPDFYAAYRDAWPLDAGYETRRDLYNLYHVLNHLNLFGRSYLGQAERLIGRLLS